MFDQAASLEQYRNTLNVVMKDQKKAGETFAWAVDFANKTPFETDDIVQATVKLQSYGLEAQKVMPQIGDMAAAMGKDLDSAVEAIADGQTGELERLKEFGITKQMIIDQANKTMKGKQIVNNKGQITDQKAFNQALFSLMKDRFSGSMDIQSKSAKGLMSTISGVAKSGLATIAGISKTGDIVQGSAFDIAKQKVSQLADKFTELQESGKFEELQKQLAFLVSNGLQKVEESIPKIIDFTQKVIDNGPQIIDTAKKIGIGFASWKVISGVSSGVETILSLAKALSILKNQYILVAAAKAKDKIETIAIIALYVKDAIVKGASTIATGALTLAQTAWNIVTGIGTAIGTAFGAVLAFITSPIGLIIIAIGSLIAIGYLLYSNWDTISKALVSIWQSNVLPFFQGMGAWFGNLFNGIGAGFKGVVNWVIGGLNSMINAVNSLDVTVPDWVPGLGGKTLGFKIPNIPAYAKGGIASQPSIFGEAGPEMAIPLKPKNPRSISLLQQTAKILGVSGGKASGNTFVFAPNISGSSTQGIMEALKMSYEEFKEYIERYFNDEGRVEF